jgi:hypothetical protein
MTHSLIIYTATLAVPVGIMLTLISLEIGAGSESRGYPKRPKGDGRMPY